MFFCFYALAYVRAVCMCVCVCVCVCVMCRANHVAAALISQLSLKGILFWFDWM